MGIGLNYGGDPALDDCGATRSSALSGAKEALIQSDTFLTLGAVRCQRWLPNYLSSDHDPLYKFHHWQANLRTLEVTEIKTVPNVPESHPSTLVPEPRTGVTRT